MKTILKGLLFFLLGAIFLEGVIYLSLPRKKFLPPTTKQPKEKQITHIVKKVKKPLPSPSPFLTKFQLSNGQMDIVKGRGIFMGYEKISGSNDLYALIKDPQKGNIYKIRILIDKSLLSSAVGAKDLDGGNRSRLEVKGRKYFFYNLTPEEREKLLPQGKMVTFYTIPLTKEEAAQKGEGVRRDDKGVICVISLIED